MSKQVLHLACQIIAFLFLGKNIYDEVLAKVTEIW